ncbi:MAG: RNA 2',3'-cyclic phosphodiesterase [PVC group bacterium]|nr:RNA 2',3'-cyclic phosphodiesterase [PVC group bacterium]
MNDSIRTFIAITINGQLRQELHRIQTLYKKNLSGKISWVAQENIHLTLKFLDNISQSQATKIKTILTQISQKNKSFIIRPDTLGAFPNLKNPRVLWVGIKSGQKQLQSLNIQIENQLEQIGFPKNEKSFHPHFTLARIKTIESQENNRPSFAQAEVNTTITSPANKITLFQSKLTPQGAIYTKLFESEFSA